MTGRTSPLLPGGDPAPGDSATITMVIGRLRAASEAAGDAVLLLGRIGTDASLWTGPAAAAFGERRDEIVRRLRAAQLAYAEAADALGRWLAQLECLQEEAAGIARQADQLRQCAEATGLAPLQRAHDDVAQRASAAARRCADDLRRATEEVRPFEHGTSRRVTDELVRASDLLDEMHKILDTATFVLGVITIVQPEFAPALLAAELSARAVDGLKLATDVTLVADGRGSWGSVGTDAAGLGLEFLGAGLGGAAGAARAQNSLRVGAGAAERHAAELANATDPVLREHGRTSAADAERFAARADEISGGLSAAWGEIGHPLRSFEEGLTLREVVEEAHAYAKPPLLRQWLPPGHVLVGAADLGARVYQARQTVADWLRDEHR